MQLQSFVYRSQATRSIGFQQIWPLLNKARVRNAKWGVTGVLVYANGQFIQCLEGRATDIDHVYSIVQRDQLHRRLLPLARENIDRRCFEQWTMGFTHLKTIAFGDPWSAEDLLPNQLQAVLTGSSRSALLLRAFINKHYPATAINAA